MKKEYVINTDSYIKSKLLMDEFFLLQIIYEKDKDMFEHLTNRSYSTVIVCNLLEEGMIKYTGEDIHEDFRESIIDILDFVLLEPAIKLFNKDNLSQKLHEVDSWIGEYRTKFKGIKPNSMGDPNACNKKMKLFLKNNPGYTKQDIFNAVDYYISQTESTYVTQADYFISKTGNDKIAISKLLMYCEQLLTKNAGTGITYGEQI